MKYKSYSAYKSSEILWLGKIPVEWDIVKLKFISEINTGSRDTQDKVPEGEYPFFVRSDKIERINEFTHDEEAVLTAGDGVGVGKVFHHYIGKFAAHQRVYLFTNFKNSIGKYIYYYLRSNLAYEVLSYNAKSTVDSLRRPMLTNFNISLPPVNDQKKIVKFLDNKLSQINDLIFKKQQQIEVLENYRQSAITETVTRGLDSNVKLKESGVKWIGEIPEHWSVKKIKFNTYVKGRIGWQGLKSDEFIDEGPYLVTGTDFVDGKVDWDTCYHVSEERYNEAIPIQLKEGDLLITKDGTIGKLAIVENKPEKAILNSGIFVTRPLKGEYITRFMYWVLSSRVFNDFIDYSSTGSTIKHLYQETFINFSYPLPEINEQIEIASYLDEKIEGINNTIKKIQEQIAVLEKYSQSIIYEAVTGKIDVRNFVEEEVEV